MRLKVVAAAPKSRLASCESARDCSACALSTSGRISASASIEFVGFGSAMTFDHWFSLRDAQRLPAFADDSNHRRASAGSFGTPLPIK